MKLSPRTQRHLVRLRHFLRKPLRDKWLFVKAYILLGLSRFIILTVSFERIARYLGPTRVESQAQESESHLAEARRVAWAIDSASRYTPWKSNCYPQAVSAKYLLHRRGIHSTLYMGAAFKVNKRDEMEAHAWLRCGPFYVTGGKIRSRFGVVAIFG